MLLHDGNEYATADRVLACARRIVERLHLDQDDSIGAVEDLVGSDSRGVTDGNHIAGW